MARKSKKKKQSLWDKALNVIFPKFTEIQFFALLMSICLLFIFSSRLQSYLWSLFTSISVADKDASGGLLLVLMAFIVPLFLINHVVRNKKISRSTKSFAGLYYYFVFGFLCLGSVESQSHITFLETSPFQLLNYYFSIGVLIVLSARFMIQIILLKLDLADKHMERIMTDTQYRPIHFILALIAGLVIMYWLSLSYASPFTLAFLTCSYTLLVLWAVDKIIRLGYFSTATARRVAVPRR